MIQKDGFSKMDRNNNAKRLFCLLLTAVLLCLQVSVSCADTKSKWNYEYEITEENTVRIVKFHGAPEDVVIPEELDGYPVTEIGFKAFNLKRTIRSVKIPDTVTVIGPQAFSSCDGIEEVKLSKNLKSIGYKAFSNCKGLRTIELPESLEDVGYNPFNLCDNLKNVTFSGENKRYEIRDGALIRKEDHCLISWFHALGTEDSYLVPKDIKTIGENAFCTCQDLKAVTLDGDHPAPEPEAPGKQSLPGLQQTAGSHHPGPADRPGRQSVHRLREADPPGDLRQPSDAGDAGRRAVPQGAE